MKDFDRRVQGAGTVIIGAEKPDLAPPSGYFAVTDTMGRVTVNKSWNEWETLPWAMVVTERNRASIGSNGVDDLPPNTKFYAWDGVKLHDMDEGAARYLARDNQRARADTATLMAYKGDNHLYGDGRAMSSNVPVNVHAAPLR